MKTEIFDYGMNGEGVAKLDGKIVLLPNAMPGEIVEYDVVKEHHNFCEGKVKQVLQKSAYRVDAVCPYYEHCGGCDLQHLSLSEQLKFKKLLVEKTIKKITGISVVCENTVACEKQFNYRNKISFNFSNGKAGFYRENSNDLVEVDNCALTDENFSKILKIFQKNVKKDINLVKNLVIRKINNQILIGVVVTNRVNLLPFYEEVNKEFSQVGVYEIINTRKDSVVLAGKVKHVAGIKEIEIENFNLNYAVDLIGFHQTNLDVQNKIYSKVLEFVNSNEVVLNGFSGQGLLSAILAKKAKHVYGIEINKSSHKSAENLKNVNKIDNLTNICGDFYKNFDKIKKKINTIILDPSKKGCGKQAMCAIIGVENIIYISCNPIALAKDLREVLDKYEIEKIIPFDMFPNTKSVETLVKLKLK